jgi:magnesium transporter
VAGTGRRRRVAARREEIMDHVVASAAYAGGRKVADVPLDEAQAWSEKPGHFVWIGLHEPGEDLLRLVQSQFGLHDLAVEDALKAHQRPKVEIYGKTLFVVLRTAQLEGRRIVYGETHVFVGKGFVVSVRHGASSSYGLVRKRCESMPDLLVHGEDFVLYSILDFVVDCYGPVLDALEAEVEGHEECAAGPAAADADVHRIVQLRRDLAHFGRIVSPLQEACLRLERFEMPMIDDAMRPYYRDVHDHVLRIRDGVDSLRETLSFSFEAAMLMASARQNDVMKKLAAWAAILAVPTAIAGIYGMNFKNMPELEWTYGYPGIVAVIALICGILYARFRKIGWL